MIIKFIINKGFTLGFTFGDGWLDLHCGLFVVSFDKIIIEMEEADFE